MSERGDEFAQPAQQAAPDGVTAGALLRQAREAAGLHVAALAASLKVPVKKLEALEDERWDLLPDMVFARALAASVCRTLKIDPQQVIERLPQMAPPRLTRISEGINTPFRAPSDGAPPSWFDHLTRPVYLAVFALLLGALVLILLPRTQQDHESSARVPVTSEASLSAPQPFVIPSAGPASSPSPATDSASAPVAAMEAVPVAMATPTTAAATTVPAAPAASAPAAAASGIVVFQAKGPSWVEVKDAKGVVALRRQLESGEAAGASGALPMQVTIGRVDQTEVQVRGKPFDLRPVSKDNVARFTVN